MDRLVRENEDAIVDEEQFMIMVELFDSGQMRYQRNL